MASIRWEVKPDEVGDDPDSLYLVEDETLLAHLLINGVVFFSSPWWREDLPQDIRDDGWVVFVNCNGVFEWGFVDAEDLPRSAIGELYQMWRRDPKWGAAVWCIKRRGCAPQEPVADAIRRDGVWDIDEIVRGFSSEEEASS